MKKFYKSFVNLAMNVLTSGTMRDHEIGKRSRIIFLNSVTLAGGIMITVFATIGFLSGNTPLGTACAAAAGIVFVNFFLIRIFKIFTVGGIIDCLVIFLFYYYLVLSGGEAGSGILWINTYPLITLFLLGSLVGSIVALGFGAAVAAAIFIPALNVSQFSALYSARVIGTYVFIWLFSLIYELVRKNALSRLEQSKARLEATTGELYTEKRQTDNILDGVIEGIFLMDRELCIGTAHSRHLQAIFESGDFTGRSILELLSPLIPERELKAVRDFFQMLVDGSVSDELLADINPLAEIRCSFATGSGVPKEKMLRFGFTRLKDSAAYPVLAVVNDVTGEFALKRQLDAEAQKHKRNMENLFRIIHVDPVMMREFIMDSEAELDEVNELMRLENIDRARILDALFMSAHAIKGNALLLGLDEFGSMVHDYETSIKNLRDNGSHWRDMLQLTIGLGDIRSEVEDLKALITKIVSFQTASKISGLADASLLQFAVEKFIGKESSRTGIPAKVIFEGLGRDSIPEEHRKLVKDIVVQFARNSFAHGFETDSERKLLGKPAEGSISLSLEWQDSQYILRYRDDGKGIDTEKIRARAQSIPEFACRAAGLDEKDIIKLIFMPGFSTADKLGTSAGRGVGMALVRTRVGEAGGKIAMRTNPGKYLEWVITLPVPLSKEELAAS